MEITIGFWTAFKVGAGLVVGVTTAAFMCVLVLAAIKHLVSR